MAETATRPTRTRAARTAATKATPAKAAPAKAESVKATAETDANGTVNRIVLKLEHAGDTKTYSKWTPPAGCGCVGTFYAPLGTQSVRIAISGDVDAE